MKEYLNLLKSILDLGTEKHPTRAESGETKNDTIGLPNLHFHWNLQDGFPLLTTRKLPWIGIQGELRAFLEGCTNNRSFEKHGCKFWKPWAKKNGNLGPIYGMQWHRHGQLNYVLNTLRKRPTDRRMVVSAWAPDQHKEMVLTPCHLMWCVTPYDGKLNLSWIQRSCDFPIGVPCNIASYALLAHLLAKWANMKPGTIDCIFCDAHIYNNQVLGVEEQLSRTPSKLPTLEIKFDNRNVFYSWQARLNNWNPQPNINFGELEV